MQKMPPDYIAKVSENTNIVDVIGEYVKLKKTGSEYSGLCPFHNEKSPSFNVNATKGLFTCRGCDKSGNVFQFLMDHVGSSFPEAVSTLAKRAGIPAPAPSQTNQYSRENEQYDRLQKIMDKVKSIYHEELLANEQAMKYLIDRGVTEETINRFEIGYAPPRYNESFRQKLKEFSEKDLVAAGLLYKSEYENGQMTEWVTHRIVFPITSSNGQVIAFGGRALMDNAKRKYINTPETLLFKKGSELFGLHQAGPAIRKANLAIVTEGYMDSVVPSGLGVENVVSAMGTAFNSANLRKLFRMADTIVFCFDPDAAGHRAALKAMETAAEVVDDHKRCKFAFLPEGMDPDEFVIKHGATAFKKLIADSEPMSKFLVREFMARNDMTCAEGKAAFASEAMAVIERVNSPLLKAFMIDDIRTVIGPHIDLPGVTPGVQAVKPKPWAEPARSALRAFKSDLTPKAAPEAITKPSQVGDESEPKNNVIDTSVASQRLKFRNRTTATMISAPSNIDSSQLKTLQEQVTPSQAMRLLAFVLREPLIAGEGDMNCTHLIGTQQEIQVVSESIKFAGVQGDKPHPSSQELIDHLKVQGHTELVDKAVRLSEFTNKNMDVLIEAEALIIRMTQRINRSGRSQRKRIARPY